MLITGLDIRIITPQGEPLRQLTLNPNKDYQPTGRPPGPPKPTTTKDQAKPGPSTMP